MTYSTPRALTIIMAVCAVIAAMTGCSTHRKGEPAAPAAVQAKRTPEVYNLARTYTPWQTLYTPFKLRSTSPMAMTFSGRATMVNGEYIHMSLRMLGMEMAVAWVDADSVLVADKLHKFLVAEPLSALTSRTGLKVAGLQAILLGQAFYPGEGALQATPVVSQLFSVTHVDDNMIMTPRRAPADISWYMTVSPGPQLSSINIDPDGDGAFRIDFSDFIETAAGLTASNFKAEGHIGSRELKAYVNWEMHKARWDDPGTTADRPTFKNYQRISMARLMEILKNN